MLQQVIDDYVKSMQPKGVLCGDALAAWLKAPEDLSECETLADEVHKFAGSAGQTGFMQLSSVATVLEIGLRTVVQAGSYPPGDIQFFKYLCDDFSNAILSLSVEKSSLFTGDEAPYFTPFLVPPQILLVAMPPATERILSYVIEQKMGFVWPTSDKTALDAVPKGREPDLAIVSEDVVSIDREDYISRYCFPVYIFHSTSLFELTDAWGLATE